MKGTLAGAAAGFLIAACVLLLVGDWIVPRAEYSHPVAFEKAQHRVYFATVLAATAIGAIVGPVVVASPLGPWLRPAAWGAVGLSSTVVLITLIIAYLRNEFPALQNNLAPTKSIDFSRTIALPLALVVGPFLGIFVAGQRRRRPAASDSG
ncbi:MAG TPA: hypothetical protein VNC50_00090 [Planctomycetia bacterium]|nr:hypothetical protein [Planctomycetia bacterium]